MKWNLVYDERVVKDIQGIGTKEIFRIKEKIEWLCDNCEEIPHQSLEGKRFNHKYKLRVGDYRVIYSLNPKQRILTIEHIGHHSSVYKLK
ncbi:MAG: type II toxin-antitoxin system RelE/ParE family toxin [Bacteroidota bacterium]|nr:type II toxin-antitoxin system RelE/ParE family toxin [Bacteroidota bacterium]